VTSPMQVQIGHAVPIWVMVCVCPPEHWAQLFVTHWGVFVV